MAKTTVKVNIDADWSNKSQRGMNLGLLEMVTDIHRRSVIIAPVLTGALRNSGKIDPVTGGYSITFGSARVVYAVRRYFENNLHPGSKEWLGKAADNVMRGDVTKYFRNKV